MSEKWPLTNNINVEKFKPLITPQEIRSRIPLGKNSVETVISSRKIICDIIMGKNNRKFIIMGPCSIHDSKSALEYAHKVRELAQEVEDKFFLVMRGYFEKPRTISGWKGLINDPSLDNSFDMNKGLSLARALLVDITRLGVPVATEALEPISPQYISELISWTAIGARTTESQTHRELASGLSSPVGFKNNTDGNVEVAINAIHSAQRPHHFLGIDQNGQTSIVSSRGNPWGHLILRGGKKKPNYDKDSVRVAQEDLKKSGITPKIVIDCSHDNSLKNFSNQPQVFEDCIAQICDGNDGIVGLMLESHLNEGKQKLQKYLEYGVSITDGCISFETSRKIIKAAYDSLKSFGK